MGNSGIPCESTGLKKHRLLIVEDDALVRVTLEMMLRPHYDLCAADSISAAQPLLQKNSMSSEGDKYAMVFCDYSLGDGTAEDLYEWIEEETPAFAGRFALMTGGATGMNGRPLAFAESAPRLEKPFTTEHVITIVTECLARRNAA